LSERLVVGTQVMETMIRGHLKGEMRFDWSADGFACEIVLPPGN
jgi:hypothetical protein